ncbi:MAG: transcriptional regulator [Spirochaetia bacterium]|nr:transcriptional regulator [Spirochaetia bacterium]
MAVAKKGKQAVKAKAKPKSQPKKAAKPAKPKVSKAPKPKKQKEIRQEKFKVGDHVVYPMHGVGQISAVAKQSILGKKKEVYVLEIASSKMRVMIPVDKALEIGIRSIISRKDVKKVIDLLRKDEVDTEEDWKIRYQNNMNKIKSGSIYSVAEVCRNLYKRAKDKELSLMERRLYESAYNLISSEIALTRAITVEEAGNLISEVLSA